MSAINDSTNPVTTDQVTTDLYQFMYISHVTSTGLLGASTLNDIAEVSIKNNTIDNITGILCYGNGYFFQYVEGSEQALTNLKNRLLMDSRHKNVKILEFSTLTNRRFTGWSLRSMILERWMSNNLEVKAWMPFKPYSWSSNEPHQFLEILQSYYEHQEEKGDMDTQPIKYNTLGLMLSKVVGQHQAFFLIQTVLGSMIVLTLLWFMFSDKF